MTSFVSLLRGINVGGNKTIRMSDLKVLYETLGFASVRTHLNSGNVVFATDGDDRTKLGALLEAAIEKEFGFRPAVSLRSAADLRKIVKGNPFPEEAEADPSHLLVMFLGSRPDRNATTRLASAYAGPERISIVGDAVYLTYPKGIGTSKLTNTLLEKQLGVVGTARNWNTVIKLSEIAAAI